MIIPYGHDRSVSRFPWLTLSIIAICTLVQIYATFFAPSRAEIEAFLDANWRTTTPGALDQAKELAERIPIIRFGYETGSGVKYTLVTSAFVHGGWFHLVGNMLFLWLAGSALEDRLGRIRFGLLYLAGAAVSAYLFSLTHDADDTILVGASGAISASMGAFLVYFSRTQIMLWYFVMFRSGTFRLAAYLALPLWFAEQFVLRAWDAGMDSVSEVAYMAHIGGFAFGFGVALVASMIWRDGSASNDGDANDRSDPIDPTSGERVDDRYRRCLAAIDSGDGAQIRLLASRTILDLARRDQPQRIVDLYKTMSGKLARVPLTETAFAAAAKAADDIGDARTSAAVLASLVREHPNGRYAVSRR